MTPPNDDPLEEALAEHLAACDEALGSGGQPHWEAPPELAARLEGMRGLLCRLRQAWPPGPPATAPGGHHAEGRDGA
jgi:hypothetical protein